MQYSTTLFRKAAIEGQKEDKLGEAMMLPKTSHVFITIMLIVWFLLLSVLLFTTTFKSKATVNGWLVNSTPSIDILNKETQSFIKTVLVSNGQTVSKGQVLAEVVRGHTELVNETIKQQQYASLNQQITLLRERKQILLNKYHHKVSLNEEMINAFRRKLKASQELEQAFTQQLEEAIMQEQALSSLFEKNLITRTVYLQQKDKSQAIALKLSKQVAAKLDLEQSVNSSQQQNLSSRIEFDEQVNLLEGKLTSLKQELSTFEGAFSYQIKSPIDGIIQNLQIEAGETVISPLPFMQVTPVNNHVKAILYVPSNHAGFIKENQAVQLKINAFPYQKFGLPTATVSYVSRHIMLPEQIKNVPMILSQPVFIIEAQLAQQHINASGEAIALKAGLLFQADIALSERSLWEWLLSPIYSLRGAL